MFNRAKKLFSGYHSRGYDAVDSRGRRRPPPTSTWGEDDIATERIRKILSASARDLARNYVLCAWAIRKHLDYVSSYSLQFNTPDRGYNEELEQWAESVMTRYAFDLALRHPFQRAVRLTEQCRVKDGDILWVKHDADSRRGKIQAVEGDRIETPREGTQYRAEDWKNGVRVNRYGAALQYAVMKRRSKSGGRELDQVISARRAIFHASLDRFDQVRGVSPIAAALNWFRDTYEGMEYALAKAKVGQLFGVAFERDASSDPYNPDESEPPLPQGMFSVDLPVGQSVNMIESKTPAAETTEFLKLMIHVALKSLDIPFSFFDESFTNFYGSKGSLQNYLKSCKCKIRDLKLFQDEWLRWRLGLAVVDREIALPSGQDFSYLTWEFVPDGVPYWDHVKEVRGHAMAVAAGFTSPQRVCREIGTDFEDNIKQIAEAREIAEENDVELIYADSTAFRPEIQVTSGEGAETDER